MNEILAHFDVLYHSANRYHFLPVEMFKTLIASIDTETIGGPDQLKRC